LFSELGESGPTAVDQRLETLLGREAAEAEVRTLVAGLSVDTLRGAVAEWLPSEGSGFSGQGSAKERINREPEPRTLNPEPSFAPAGTWFRDDVTLSIRYRPVAHADPVLAGWLELLTLIPSLSQQPLALAALKELTNPTAAGLCGSCHSIEQSAVDHLAINWRAYDRTSRPRAFTKFSHGPHLLLPELSDCTGCHAMDDRINAADSYAGWDPHRFTSEFLPISKRQCAECHTATAAGDRCQSCHNYHVGEIGNGPEGVPNGFPKNRILRSLE
jgi:hypothetical protein